MGRLSTIIVVIGLLVATQGAVHSQEPDGFVSGRGDDINGDAFTYNFSRGATVLVVTGAPYSARTSSPAIRTLANGTHLADYLPDQSMTYRDSTGRTRIDARMQLVVPPGTNMPPILAGLTTIIDPVAGYRYILDPVHRIAHRGVVQGRRKPAEPPPAAEQSPRTMEDGSTVVDEDLGTQTMFGIIVAGARTTTTYPVGALRGNDQPLTMVSETWRSAQYGLILLGIYADPALWVSTTAMKDFTPEDPDPALFQVPTGYQVVDEAGEFTVIILRNAP